MTANIESKQWINNLLYQGQTLLDKKFLAVSDDDWVNGIRHQARSSLETMKTPTRKDEIWRYSNIDKLFKQPFKLINDECVNEQALKFNQAILSESDNYLLVIVNGHYISDLSRFQHLSEKVTINSLHDALLEQSIAFTCNFGQIAQQEPNIFSALNTALINNGIFLHIGSDVILDKAIEIININSVPEHPMMVHPRNLIVMERGASATIIERYVNYDQLFYFNNNLTEIVLHDEATLNHYRIQDESNQAYHMGTVFVSQMTQSEYHNTTFSVGGDWARTNINVDLRGQMAQCHLHGLYSVGEQQLTDFHTKVKHSAPNCTSSENFKGIIHGKGRAIFDGHIVVDKEAQGTDACMTNANLLLTPQAEVDTKPQLEIYADNVTCSHGTTVGQLEPDQIFYLRSRGIDESRAKQMLCFGFAAEIIKTINNEPLVGEIATQLQEQLLF